MWFYLVFDVWVEKGAAAWMCYLNVKCGVDIFCTKSFYLFIVSCKTILHYCIVVGAVEVNVYKLINFPSF